LTDCLTDIVVNMTPLARVILLLSVLVAESFRRPGWSARQRLPTTTQAIPRDLVFDASQIEIIRVLGKIDVMVDKQTLDEAGRAAGDLERVRASVDGGGRATSVRVFEARIPGGNRCFLKEYLPIGLSFGLRELAASRKLAAKWNELEKPVTVPPPFPILLGSLKTDERIENAAFRERWAQRFPRTRPPERGNVWLIFKWDASAFRAINTYPRLPQVCAQAWTSTRGLRRATADSV
jgi:hypothetical protein